MMIQEKMYLITDPAIVVDVFDHILAKTLGFTTFPGVKCVDRCGCESPRQGWSSSRERCRTGWWFFVFNLLSLRMCTLDFNLHLGSKTTPNDDCQFSSEESEESNEEDD